MGEIWAKSVVVRRRRRLPDVFKVGMAPEITLQACTITATITDSTTAISSRSALVVRSTTTRMAPAGLKYRPVMAGIGFTFAVTTTATNQRPQMKLLKVGAPGSPVTSSGADRSLP